MATLPLTLRRLGLGEPPWLIGHRGAPGPVAENTMASLQAAIHAGADAAEVDLQLTIDGELVATHDWSLERLADAAHTVEAATAEEILAVELLAPPEVGEDGRRIPTLAEVLAGLPAEFPLNLELKRRRADPERLLDRLLELIAGRDRLWISSFDWELLERMHQRDARIPLAPLASRRRRGLAAVAERIDAVALHVSDRALSQATLRRSASVDRPVLVYTVNGATEAHDLLQRGVSGVFTDQPANLRRDLEALRARE